MARNMSEFMSYGRCQDLFGGFVENASGTITAAREAQRLPDWRLPVRSAALPV